MSHCFYLRKLLQSWQNESMTNLVDYAQLEFGLSDRLAKALNVSKTSSSEMAEALDVTPTTISNYTSGRTRPRKPVVQAWALKTGVPISWLETGVTPGGGDPEMSPSDYKPAVSIADYRRLALVA